VVDKYNLFLKIKTMLFNITALFFLSVLLSITMHSCNPKVEPNDPNSPVWEASLTEMLPSTMINTIKGSDLQASIPIEIQNKKGKPLKGASFIIHANDKKIFDTTTTIDGIVILKITDQLLSNKPSVKISKTGYLAKDIAYEVGGKTVKITDVDEPVEVVNLSNLKFIKNSGLKIHYTENSSSNAMAYVDTFHAAIEFCRNMLGNRNIKLIHPILIQSSNVSTLGESKEDITMPINTNNWKNVHWYYIHETIEYNMISLNNVYGENPYLRYIGDGLAEWSSLNYLSQVNHHYENKMLKNRLNTLENSRKSQFVLNEWKSSTTGIIEGYSYSLAFWLLFEKRFGHDAILAFIKTFNESSNYGNSHIAQLLKNAAGEENIPSLTMKKEQTVKLLNEFEKSPAR
jgi:hypothetical protein